MFTLGQEEVELVYANVRDVVISSEWTDFIVHSRAEIAERLFVVVETSDTQVAIVYLDGKLARSALQAAFCCGGVQCASRSI